MTFPTSDSHVTGVDIDRTNLAGGQASQSTNINLAPTDAMLRQPGVVYTLQEVLAQVNQKLDEHSRQLAAIWAKLVALEFEQSALTRTIDEMKDDDRTEHDREEKRQQARCLLWFRFGTMIGVIVIIVMLAWLISHLGGLR